MAIINPALPVIGGQRGDGEQAVRNGLSSLLGEFNGNIESANIKDASILAADLADGVAASDAELQRAIFMGQVQPGVYAAGDLMVTQRAAGANNSVDVAAGYALVAAPGSGLLVAVSLPATVNLPVAANSAADPRVDQVVINSIGAVSIKQGTPQAGATLNNAAGSTSRAGLAASELRLGEFAVPAGFTSTSTLSNTSIRDRRPDARGAEYAYQRTAGDITLNGTSYQNLSASDAALGARLECSGAPLHVHVVARLLAPASAVDTYTALYQDGVILSGGERYLISIGAGGSGQMNTWWTVTPAAGSHYFDIYVRMTTTGGTLHANVTQGCVVEFQEVVRQNAKRNTTTSG